MMLDGHDQNVKPIAMTMKDRQRKKLAMTMAVKYSALKIAKGGCG